MKMKIGKNFQNHGEIERWNPQCVDIGDNCLLGTQSKIVLHGPILPYRKDNKVVLGDMTWVGFRSTILMGTKLGRGCLVGTGAVVQGHYPAYSIVAGVPAKTIRKRDAEELLRFYIIRFLMKTVLGTVQPDWSLLTMSHIKYALGHNTDEPFDSSLNLDTMSVEDVLKHYNIK